MFGRQLGSARCPVMPRRDIRVTHLFWLHRQLEDQKADTRPVSCRFTLDGVPLRDRKLAR